MIFNENSNDSEVRWIGSRLKKVKCSQLTKNNVVFYNKCLVGALILCEGDYILIRDADAVEPDTVDGCDIGKILHLFENLTCDDAEQRYRAIVQWYARPKALPHSNFDDDNICIDFDREVIKDGRPFDSDITLWAIFGKCKVIETSVQQSAMQVLEHYISKKQTKTHCAMFVCRYKFVRVNRKYQLVPLQSNPAVVATPKGNNAGERRINLPEFVDVNDCENKVSPIKIIGGRSVVRMSTSAKKQHTTTKNNNNEENYNYYTIASPLIEKNERTTPKGKAALAKRNLNLSLEDDADATAESDCLNYSIVQANSPSVNKTADDIKIKLRVSETRRLTRLASVEHKQEIQPKPLTTCEQQSDGQNTRKRAGVAADASHNDIYISPTKKNKDDEGVVVNTPITTRRKSILKSASSRAADGTPRRSICLSNVVEERLFKQNDIICTPKSGRSRRSTAANNDPDYTPKKSTGTISKTPTRAQHRSASKSNITISPPKTPQQKMKLIRSGELSPSMSQRLQTQKTTRKSDLEMTRERLHVSVVPKSLPCREKEFDNIYSFLEGKIQDQCGGCMYVSGVPGTGKTATVTGVIRALQRAVLTDDLEPFEFLEINGMRLTEPRQAYVQIYKQLTGKTINWEHAHSLLEKRFTTPAPRRRTTVLLVDELDILCNRRQDVVYNLMDWPTKAAARLVVITIANTMDLPERLLMGKVTSRLGLTRLTFQPYSHKQLQQIVTERLGFSDAFKSDAVQLVARKVAAVSGDARRALDICRRATEIAENSNKAGKDDELECVNMQHVQLALGEMISGAKVQAIKNCSQLEQLFLQAVVAEITRTGVEETNFMCVYTQLEAIATFMGYSVPNPGRAMSICSKLGSRRLLICEHGRNDIFQKILLNVSTDDIHYALKINNEEA